MLVVTALCRILLETLGGELTFVQYVQGSLYFFMQVENLGKLLEMLVNRNHFITCLELVNKSDAILKNVGLSVSYKLFNIIFITIIVFFPIYNLFIISAVWEWPSIVRKTGFSSIKSLSFIFQLVNSSIVYIIRNCSIYCHMSFIIIAYQRIRRMNEHLRYTECKRRNDEEIVKSVIYTTKDLHNVLYKLTLEVNKIFAWAIFDTISVMLLELIAAVFTLKYSSTYEPLHGYLGGATFVGVEVMVLLIVSENVKNEVKDV